MYAYFYLVTWRIRVLDLTFASDILSITKPHISEYSRFRLLLNSEARRLCAAMASVLVILSAEYTMGVRER